MPNGRTTTPRYAKRENDLATLDEVMQLIDGAFARYHERHRPWYSRLWRWVRDAATD